MGVYCLQTLEESLNKAQFKHQYRKQACFHERRVRSVRDPVKATCPQSSFIFCDSVRLPHLVPLKLSFCPFVGPSTSWTHRPGSPPRRFSICPSQVH